MEHAGQPCRGVRRNANVITLVYAVSRNGVIGRNGGLPWHIPSDLKHFKEVTLGKPVIMGRKTWESLPRKPLPGRLNIVISRRRDFHPEGAVAVPDAAAALLAAHGPEACVIGGAEVFKLFWPSAGRIHLSLVLADVEGDTFMPQIAPETWAEVARGPVLQGEKDSHPFQTLTFERRPV
ncbi:MAG: dihydrofolate reductase [Alphaproteobacteria bacterium]|nr:dihydrofolate reductase [Alphaproteobacteria bacterium]